MALRQAGLISRAEAASTLAVATRSGEGFRVRRIFVSNVSAASAFATILNDTHQSDYLFVIYGTNLSIISATGYNKLDNCQSPAEMMKFPFGPVGQGLVPAGKKVDLQVLGGQPAGRFTSAGNTAQNQYLRLRMGTAPATTLLDRNDVGFPFFGVIPGAAGGDYTSVRSSFPSTPRSFETLDDVAVDFTFNPNDELSLQLQTTIVGTGTLAAGDADVWVLERVSTA